MAQSRCVDKIVEAHPNCLEYGMTQIYPKNRLIELVEKLLTEGMIELRGDPTT
jgi:hypothetical protein